MSVGACAGVSRALRQAATRRAGLNRHHLPFVNIRDLAWFANRKRDEPVMTIPRVLFAALIALAAGVAVETLKDKPSPTAAEPAAKLALAIR